MTHFNYVSACKSSKVVLVVVAKKPAILHGNGRNWQLMIHGTT